MSAATPISAITLAPARSPRVGFALLIGLLAMFAAGKVILADTLDPDCFWHLRVAEQIAAGGWPGPLVDHLSFASSPQPWVPYSWLAELGMKMLWDAGGYRAAIALQAMLEAGFLVLVALAALEASRTTAGESRYFASGIATVFAAVLSLAYLSFRPVSAALLILALCAWLLLRDRRRNQKSRAVWAVPVLTALATNFHFFAIFVPLWTLALLVGDALEPRLARFAGNPPRRLARGGLLAGLCIAGFMMTPMLGGELRSIVNYSLHDVMVRSSLIAEMQPFYHGGMGWISAALVALLVVCVLRNFMGPRSADDPRAPSLGLGEMIWLAGSAVILLRVGRMAPVFALIAAPCLAATLPRLSDRVFSRLSILAMMCIVLALGAVRIVRAFPGEAQPLSAWLDRNGSDCPSYPCAAADYVQSHIRPGAGRLLCEFSWGGYLEYRLGNRYQMLMDGRTQVFSSDFWNAAYFGSREDQRRLLESTGADVAVLPRQHSAFVETLKNLNWRIAYQDDYSQVLVPSVRPY